MKVGFFNAAGLANKLDAIDEFLKENNCDTCFVTETKYHRYKSTTSHPFIAASSRLPSEFANVPTIHGVALLANDSLHGRWQNRITVQATDDLGHFLVWSDGDVQFVGLYLPPTTDRESFDVAKSIIDSAFREANKQLKRYRFVIGDLNIRVERDSEQIRARLHVDLMTELEIASSCARIPMIEGSYTFFGNGNYSIVDHAMASNDALLLSPTVKSLDKPYQVYHGSDHCFMVLEYDDPLDFSDSQDEECFWGFNTGKLSNQFVFEDFRNAYALMHANMNEDDYIALAVDDCGDENIPCWTYDVRYRKSLPCPVNTTAYIDSLERCILGPVLDTATQVIGINERKGRRIPPVVNSPKLKNLRLRKNATIQDLKKRFLGQNRFVNPTEEEHVLLNELQKEIETEMAFQRNHGYFKFYRSIDRMSAAQLSKMLRSLQTTRMKRKGTLPSEAADMEYYRTHFENQYSSPDGNGVEFERPVLINNSPVPFIYDVEVTRHIRYMTSGKAPGPSKISVDLLKPCLPLIGTPLSLLFNEVLRLNTVPSSWQRANLVPIPKKPNPTGVDEHRPISLTEHIRKIFEHLIHPFITEAVEPLNACQCGFRSDRSTIDQAASLNEIMKQFAKRTGQKLEVTFLDIKAAYDSVDRRLLWKKCLDMGVPLWTVNILQQLFDHCQSKVVIRSRESSLFPHRAGLMQGSVISPVLYSIFVNSLADALDATATLEIGGRKVGGLFYADDIALMAETSDQMRRLLAVCESHSLANNYRFNPRKCETFSPADSYQLYGTFLPHCDSFKYLGIWFDSQGIDWNTHISKMIVRAKEAAFFFKAIGCNGYGMGERTKTNIYKLFIRSRMEYGLAIMPRTQSLLTLWDRAQDSIMRIIFSVGPNTSCASMRVLLHLQSARTRHDELSCRWMCALTLKSGQNFLIANVLHQAKAVKIKDSCFSYTLSTKNRLLEQMRANGIIGTVLWEKAYEPIRDHNLFQDLVKDKTKCSRPEAMVIYLDRRPRQAYAIGNESRATRRIIILYLLGKLLGEPPICRNCSEERHASQNHVIECTNSVGIDNMVKGGRYQLARFMIIEAIRRCAPAKAAYYDKMIDMTIDTV
jgi:hypothetical protein